MTHIKYSQILTLISILHELKSQEALCDFLLTYVLAFNKGVVEKPVYPS